MDSDREQAQKLAALVMAPKCVLKACKVSSAENLHVLTAVPIKIATDLSWLMEKLVMRVIS